MATYGTPYRPRSPYSTSAYTTPGSGSPGGNLASAFRPPDSQVGNSQYGGQYAAPVAPRAPGSLIGAARSFFGGQTGGTPPAAPPPTAPNVYDITTDPALQAITALTGRSDEDAQAQALKQRQGQLLGYGDQNLAQSVLGDPTIAQAAGQNPTSTLAQLGQHRTQNVHDLTEGLNKQNLFYGGYRVTQEQQAAQDYQNALAAAAAGVNNNLDTISGNLAQTLAANQAQRIAALQAAYQNQPAGTASGDGTGVAPPAGAPATADGNLALDPGMLALSRSYFNQPAPTLDPNLLALARSLGLGTTTAV